MELIAVVIAVALIVAFAGCGTPKVLIAVMTLTGVVGRVPVEPDDVSMSKSTENSCVSFAKSPLELEMEVAELVTVAFTGRCTPIVLIAVIMLTGVVGSVMVDPDDVSRSKSTETNCVSFEDSWLAVVVEESELSDVNRKPRTISQTRPWIDRIDAVPAVLPEVLMPSDVVSCWRCCISRRA